MLASTWAENDLEEKLRWDAELDRIAELREMEREASQKTCAFCGHEFYPEDGKIIYRKEQKEDPSKHYVIGFNGVKWEPMYICESCINDMEDITEEG